MEWKSSVAVSNPVKTPTNQTHHPESLNHANRGGKTMLCNLRSRLFTITCWTSTRSKSYLNLKTPRASSHACMPSVKDWKYHESIFFTKIIQEALIDIFRAHNIFFSFGLNQIKFIVISPCISVEGRTRESFSGIKVQHKWICLYSTFHMFKIHIKFNTKCFTESAQSDKWFCN